jgi:hypothetical protein
VLSGFHGWVGWQKCKRGGDCCAQGVKGEKVFFCASVFWSLRVNKLDSEASLFYVHTHRANKTILTSYYSFFSRLHFGSSSSLLHTDASDWFCASLSSSLDSLFLFAGCYYRSMVVWDCGIWEPMNVFHWGAPPILLYSGSKSLGKGSSATSSSNSMLAKSLDSLS